MITAILGKKLGMTQVFQGDGRCVPVTVIEAGPCTVTQLKRQSTDGYDAVQLGYDPIVIHKLNRSLRGHLSKAQKGGFRVLKEVKLDNHGEPPEGIDIGAEIRVDIFSDAKKVDVSGVSKGKGFQGVMKRHGYAGGRASHGSMFHRAPGSIGSGTDPAHVWKGKGLPGRMGHRRVTQLNLEVVQVIPEKNLILVHGAVPGPTGAIVVVRKRRGA